MRRLIELLRAVSDLWSAADWLWRLLWYLCPGPLAGLGAWLLATSQHTPPLAALDWAGAVFLFVSVGVWALIPTVTLTSTNPRILPHGAGGQRLVIWVIMPVTGWVYSG